MLTVMAALPAVLVPKKNVWPPLLVMVDAPAELVSLNLRVPPLVMAAELALLALWKMVVPLFAMLVMPLVSPLKTLNVPLAPTVTVPRMEPPPPALPSCNVPSLIVVPPV